jgi:hypothetical protein
LKEHKKVEGPIHARKKYSPPRNSKRRVLTFESCEENISSEVTLLREDKNKNGKRNPETQITGKKARKLSKKKAKLEKLQKFQRRLHRRQICRT